MVNLILKTIAFILFNVFVPSFMFDGINMNTVRPIFMNSSLSSAFLPKFSSIAFQSIQEITQVLPDEVLPFHSDLSFDLLAKYSLFTKSDSIFIIEVKPLPTDNVSQVNHYSVSPRKIRLDWTVLVHGKITGVVASADKSSMALSYRVVEGSELKYRIKTLPFIAATSVFQKQNYEMGQINLMKDDYFSNDTMYDVLLPGNSPVTAMAVLNDVLVYGRSYDNHAFYVLKFDNTNAFWKTTYEITNVGPVLLKTRFYHLKSIKILSSKKGKLNLMLTKLIMYDTELLEVIEHHTLSQDGKENVKEVKSYSYDLTPLFKGAKLADIIERSSFFSSSSGDSFIFRVGKDSFKAIDYDHEEDKNYLMSSIISNHDTVEMTSLAGCDRNENFIITKNGKLWKYLVRDKQDMLDSNVTEFLLDINTSGLPTSIKDAEFVAVSTNLKGNKLVVHLLSTKGDVHTLDFTSNFLNFTRKSSLEKFIMLNFKPILVILVIFIDAIALYVISRKPESFESTNETATRLLEDIRNINRQLNFERNKMRTRRIMNDFNETMNGIISEKGRKLSV